MYIYIYIYVHTYNDVSSSLLLFPLRSRPCARPLFRAATARSVHRYFSHSLSSLLHLTSASLRFYVRCKSACVQANTLVCVARKKNKHARNDTQIKLKLRADNSRVSTFYPRFSSMNCIKSVQVFRFRINNLE